MNAQKRKEIMKRFADASKEYSRLNDWVLAEQAANDWYALATASEIKRAPKYIWWTGRRRT